MSATLYVRSLLPAMTNRLKSLIQVSSAQYWHYVNRAVTKIRAVLVVEVFHKTESLPADGAENTDSITLMSTDVERICKGIKFAHEIWATAIDTGIALFLLERQVGIIAIAPVGIALGMSH